MTSKGIVFDLDTENSDSATAYDKSRYRTTGTVTSTLPVERGYYFNGSTSGILFTTAAQLRIARSLITLIAWIKTGNVAEMAIIDKMDDGDTPTAGYALRTDAAGHAVFTTDTDEYDSAVQVCDNKPHFIAGVLEDNIQQKNLIVDDTLISKAYFDTIDDSAKNLGIGYQVNPEIRFTGRIYFVQVYNVGLNFGQLMNIYNSTKHKYI